MTKTKTKRYKSLGFYNNRLKLYLNKLYFLNVDLGKLIQADDTDFPHFSKSKKGWTLNKIHKWITKENKNGIAGNIEISKEKLKYALELCEKSQTQISGKTIKKKKKQKNNRKEKTKKK